MLGYNDGIFDALLVDECIKINRMIATLLKKILSSN
jgi:hypothetical protein